MQPLNCWSHDLGNFMRGHDAGLEAVALFWDFMDIGMH